jgi:FKBP-type peptidyl-prolyl cis-trans isomerase FkpA
MYFKILSEGEGDDYIRLTDVVRFSYVGTFLDGEVFQEISEEESISYKVTQLIAGWQDALCKLKKGGEIKIIIPPYLGYGSKETGVIPANSILVYELKVLDVL